MITRDSSEALKAKYVMISIREICRIFLKNPSKKNQWENEIFGNFQDIWSEKYPTLPLGINLIPLATYNLKISSYWYDSLISVHFLYKSSWDTFQKFVKFVHPVEAVTIGPIHILRSKHIFSLFWSPFPYVSCI